MFPKKKTIHWHWRLGHIIEKGLWDFPNKGIAKGVYGCLDIDFMKIVYIQTKLGKFHVQC